MKTWQVQEAKAKFSEVVRLAAAAPQFVTMRGKPAVVVLSQKDYLKLKRSKPSLLELMRSSPFAEIDLSVERDRSLPRGAEL